MWSCSPELPNSLTDLLDTGDSEEVDEEELEFDDEFSGSDSECHSNNYHVDVHERLRRGCSEKLILYLYQ